VLDCTGPGFPGHWATLHRSLASGRRAEASVLGRKLLERWGNRSAEKCEELPKILLGETSHRVLQGFCPYGYAAAARAVSWSLKRSDRGDKKRRNLLEDALACAAMGKRWWTWNFYSDTRWQSMVAPLGLAEELTLLRRRDLGRKQRTGKSEDLYLAEYRKQLERSLALRLPVLRSSASLDPTKHSKLGFAAFGVHTTTLLEPMFALKNVLPESMHFEFTLFGATHPPSEKLTAEVCLPEAHRLLCQVSYSPDPDWWTDLVDQRPLQRALDELAKVVLADPLIRQSHCLICGGGNSPTLCLLLRMVTELPMLITLQAPLAFRMPSDEDHRALLVALFREVVRPSPASRGRTVTSTSLIFLQRQVWIQTGCLLPVVRNHNLYAAEAALNADPAPDAKEVIFWQNHVALKPDVSMCLWRYLKQRVSDAGDFPFNLVFKNVKKLPGKSPGRKVYGLSGDLDAVMATYAGLSSRFAAAVLFPHDVGMISFDDLYAVALPIFMPEPELIATIAYAQLASTRNYPWYLLREQHAQLHYARADDVDPPWDPGWNWQNWRNASAIYTGTGMLDAGKLREAIATANYVLLPHIHRFSSITDLLHQLAHLSAEDLLATRRAMRQSATEAWEVTKGFYQRASRYLLADDAV
ncbi:unnamed protein product, partial [Symbiodinium microadriaticum]